MVNTITWQFDIHLLCPLSHRKLLTRMVSLLPQCLPSLRVGNVKAQYALEVFHLEYVAVIGHVYGVSFYEIVIGSIAYNPILRP